MEEDALHDKYESKGEGAVVLPPSLLLLQDVWGLPGHVGYSRMGIGQMESSAIEKFVLEFLV